MDVNNLFVSLKQRGKSSVIKYGDSDFT